MREAFDEIWIIDLEGDSYGARKTENVFAIRPPVAIAIGVRYASPQPDVPATVRKARLIGSAQQKLSALSMVRKFEDLPWRLCATKWGAPFDTVELGPYFGWPAITDVFPWQHSGTQMKRKWPIGETKKLLEDRWRCLLSNSPNKRGILFRETDDRDVSKQCANLLDARVDPPIGALSQEEPCPEICEYGFRSFDRQYLIRDARLGDRIRPVLHRAHSNRQVYITSLLTKVLGTGPAAVATGAIPDLDHFCGRGAKDVIPLWRDANASKPNVTRGLLDVLSSDYGYCVSAEDLFAYTYAILAQPAYTTKFWEELEKPSAANPIDKGPWIVSANG